MHHFTSFVIKNSTIWLYLLSLFLFNLGCPGLVGNFTGCLCLLCWHSLISEHWLGPSPTHLLHCLITNARCTVPLRQGKKDRAPWMLSSASSSSCLHRRPRPLLTRLLSWTSLDHLPSALVISLFSFWEAPSVSYTEHCLRVTPESFHRNLTSGQYVQSPASQLRPTHLVLGPTMNSTLLSAHLASSGSLSLPPDLVLRVSSLQDALRKLLFL